MKIMGKSVLPLCTKADLPNVERSNPYKGAVKTQVLTLLWNADPQK